MPGEDRHAYGAEDGTVFDTTYREHGDVYVAKDGTVVAKPAPEDAENADARGESEDE